MRLCTLSPSVVGEFPWMSVMPLLRNRYALGLITWPKERKCRERQKQSLDIWILLTSFFLLRFCFSHAQQRISLAYALVIAILSLAVAAGFMVYGWKLRVMLRQSSRSTKKQVFEVQNVRNTDDTFFLMFVWYYGIFDTSRRFFDMVLTDCFFLVLVQISRISVVFSVSFILHCIFILIVIGLKEPNAAFSFVGLVATEMIPSFLFLFSNRRFQWKYLIRKSTSHSDSTSNTREATSNTVQSPKIHTEMTTITSSNTSRQDRTITTSQTTTT